MIANAVNTIKKQNKTIYEWIGQKKKNQQRPMVKKNHKNGLFSHMHLFKELYIQTTAYNNKTKKQKFENNKRSERYENEKFLTWF